MDECLLAFEAAVLEAWEARPGAWASSDCNQEVEVAYAHTLTSTKLAVASFAFALLRVCCLVLSDFEAA